MYFPAVLFQLLSISITFFTMPLHSLGPAPKVTTNIIKMSLKSYSHNLLGTMLVHLY